MKSLRGKVSFKRIAYVASVLVSIELIGFAVFYYKITHAQMAQLMGGQIEFVFDCTCDGTHVVQVGSPDSGSFLVGFQSQVYDYHNTRIPGTWLLGTINPGGQCQYECDDGDCCDYSPVDGAINITGTSGI